MDVRMSISPANYSVKLEKVCFISFVFILSFEFCAYFTDFSIYFFFFIRIDKRLA